MQPKHYRMYLTINLEAFRFSGTTEIDVALSQETDTITLHAKDLAVWQCTILTTGKNTVCPFTLTPAEETLTIRLPEKMTGAISLRIEYEGKIGDNLAGLYRSRYKAGDTKEYVAVTQFQESDARRVFPCFDEPGRKATFQITLIIPPSLTAVSNTAVAEEVLLENGTKRVSFEPTPVMSTYLVFMGVGPFAFIEDPGEIKVRVATMPGLTHRADFSLAFGRKALTYCQDYFGIAYPFTKLDLLAVEDFAAGAMENWGAITFRENLLLYDANATSRAGEQRICEVIAHEMAHQWFGDLVSPADWKYIWLNESFATFFGFGVMDHYYPQWEVWAHFLHAQTAPALRRDGLKETCAIEIPGGEHIVINTSTAPIIYNKGGSVLRQIMGYLGEDNFRNGIMHYLKKHAYGCATSRDLWTAFEEVSHIPLSAIMERWVHEPGHPVVNATGKSDGLHLRQKRFTYLPNDSTQQWMIPVTVEMGLPDGERKTAKTLLKTETGTIEWDRPPLWYKVNAGQTGFYRVAYDDLKNIKQLGLAISAELLSAEDRWGIQEDLYAQVMAGSVSLDDYLMYLNYFIDEKAYLPLMGITGNLFHAFLITRGSAQGKTVTSARTFLERILARIGWQPAGGEHHTVPQLRDHILWHALLYDFTPAVEGMLDQFRALMNGETIHPDIIKSVMQAGALKGDERTFAWFRQKLESSNSEHERMNILIALGSFGDAALLEKIRAYVLAHVPPRNQYLPLSVMAFNPCGIPSMWPWFLDHIDAIEAFPPVHFERVITATVPIGGMDYEQEVRAFFKKYTKTNKAVRDSVALSLEKLEINVRMRDLTHAEPFG